MEDGMTKYIQLSIVVSFLFLVSACYQKAPVLDKQSPQLSVMVSDSRYNSNNAYSYMLYESNGPREEAGFVTKEASVNIRAHAADVGGVKSIVIRAENGTLTPVPYVRSIETSVDGNASIVTINGDPVYAQTPLEHMVIVTPNGSNEVLVSVSVQDLGGFSGRSNTTATPEIKVVFSSQ
jgi:hypothetical protein